jgi:predicted ATPase
LTAAWEKVLGGEAAQVTVVAEPGVGKSALAACFIERVPIEPRRVIEFAGSLGERNAPFACLRQTIARHLQAAGALTAEDARRALAGWLGTTDETAAPHVETMLALWRGDLAAGSEGRAAVFAAAAALFAAIQPPVLVVLEDAHWIDPSTLELLDRILGAAGTGRLALVLTRPDARLDWQRADDATIRLRQLDPAGCRRLIEAVAGCPVGASLAQRIEAATDGLPLYVEEFTKALLESGQVRRQRGVLRSAELDAAIETPASLLDLITSRLDRLGDAKIFAQIAAVLGRRFDRAAFWR